MADQTGQIIDLTGDLNPDQPLNPPTAPAHHQPANHNNRRYEVAESPDEAQLAYGYRGGDRHRPSVRVGYIRDLPDVEVIVFARHPIRDEDGQPIDDPTQVRASDIHLEQVLRSVHGPRGHLGSFNANDRQAPWSLVVFEEPFAGMFYFSRDNLEDNLRQALEYAYIKLPELPR